MKRIASLVMAMLMVVTTFCGILSVTSTADEVYDACENVVEVTVVASEVAEDGTFDVEWWVKDNSPYGFLMAGFNLRWDDTKVAPVVDRTIEGEDVYFNVSNVQYWLDEANVTKVKRASKAAPALSSQVIVDEEAYEVFVAPTTTKLSVDYASTGLYTLGYGFSMEYFDEIGVDYEAFTMDETKGMLWATGKFQVLEGATGEAVVTAFAGNDAFTTCIDEEKISADGIDTGDSRVTITPATVTLPSAEEPSAVTLVTDDAASIRTNAPAGIRFSGEITATDWTGVTEFGIRLTKGETSLDIPAKVDATGAVIDIAALTEGQTVEFNAVLSGLKEANYAADFTATTYVKYEDSTEEVGNAVVKNAADTAAAALADASAEYTADQKAYLETLAAAAA